MITRKRCMFQIVSVLIRKCSSRSSNMLRILNVAEKNDAAKSLSDIMSGGRYRKREGFSRFNKIYEYDYHILNQNCRMTMTSVSGHLLNFEFTSAHKKWYSCNPLALFEAPVTKQCPEDYRDIKRTLENEAKGCQTLIIWTDCDREGENIGFEIIQVCKAVKPNLRVLRARFSEITQGAVARACANLLEPDKNTNDAVDVRQELDLRIGAAFTRFQTLRLQKVFPEVLNDSLISYGSCQFPTLGFIVERYNQVQAFVPEPFWKIRVVHETDEGAVEFSWNRVRLFDHLACLVIYEHVIESPLATVIDVRSKPKSKWRPVALDTVELEKLASRKLRINAKETMKIAEKLYTQGFISYPRTETNGFPKDMDLRGLVELQTVDAQWGGFASGILERGGPTPRNGNKSDQAHPPIHPLKHTSNLQGNEGRLYEFVVRHFLACCSQDARGQETTIDLEINEEKFSASGLMIIARNYLEVYPYDKWTDKAIPIFHKGETFQPKVIEMNQGETSPPSLLTEADLIALMDKHGIGTDATHADHIEKIKSRTYAGVRDDGRFIPGELGMGLVQGYDAMGFEMSKPHLRAELEADLKRICDGVKNKDAVLAGQIRKYKEVFMEACDQATKIDEALSQYFGQAQAFTGIELQSSGLPVRPCPECGEAMSIKTKKDGRGLFLSCCGYPKCRNAIWFPDFVLAASREDEVCQKCNPGPVQLIKFKFKKGSVPPYIPVDYVGCVGGCDSMLIEVLGIRLRNNSAPSQTRGYVNTQSQRSTNRTTQFPDSGYSSSQSTNNSYSRSSAPNRPHGSQTTGNSTMNSGVPRTPMRDSGVGNNYRTEASDGGGGGGGGGGGSCVVCNCGLDARMLTVRKEGPNTGRQFYSCSKPKDQTCGFFLWADEDSNSGAGQSSNVQSASSWQNRGGQNVGQNSLRPTGQSNDNYGGGHGTNNVQCNCGENARLLTVQKEGNNKGRQFYSCSKPRDQGCKFFQWADEPGAVDSTRNYGGGGSGKAAGGWKSKGKAGSLGDCDGPKQTKRKAPPTCSGCGQKGHTIRSCKNK